MMRAWRMYLKILSKILAVVGIYASQEDFILTTFNNLSISSSLEKDLEVPLDSSLLYTKEIDKSCTKYNRENPIELEINELSPFLSVSLVCIPETNYPSLPGMTEEEFKSGPNEETC